ncbi:hypothetical protein C6P40_004984 [Pichia californica]|uniref:Phosphatase n=1 Tax=Pichia californica TaxID=460514 RepID=A0A9P7BHI0_9ASCO|nr:hypothetical protein C6P42_005342 [[Candida] californica]KAG0689448.1 hypothetical protein C6P40_004984 [[Candida] californica]
MTPKAIVFTDWDGTVTLQDSNDMLTDDLGMGHKNRMLLNDKIINNELTFRNAFKEMLDSVSKNGYNLQYCIDYLIKNVKLDPGFENTVKFCSINNIPLIVVSSGIDIIIESLLFNLLDPSLHKFIQIYSNHVKSPNEFDSWNIVYRDNSDFGHDKNQSILHAVNKYYGSSTERGTLFYCGDGVSDVSAARSCDLLFAKSGHDLVDICIRDKINYLEFNSFHDILSEIKKELNL